jgi:hypothetical protein
MLVIQMENDITYREIPEGDEEDICQLIMECFNEFVVRLW